MHSSEQLIALFKRCTVRLSTSKESGTGFFVAPGFLLTCAHVVGNVESDKISVTVQWEEKTYLAKIACLVPDPYPDLALLKLEDAPLSHPCMFLHHLHQEPRINDDLYGYGYPDLYPNGDPSSFKFVGTTGTTPILMKFKSGEVRQGLSGGPLLNLRTGSVCGVMKLTRGVSTRMGGRGIPVAIVFEQFPKLVSLQQDFHRKDRRWYDFLTPEQRREPGIIIPQKFSYNTISHPVLPITASQEVEPRPMLLGFALDMSSSALTNLRPNLNREKEKSAINVLIEAAKSVHVMLESDPELLKRLQTSLFLYAFGLKLRPIIDVYTCMSIAQHLITPEIVESYKKPDSSLASIFKSFSEALPIDHRRSLRNLGANYVENVVAKEILEDYAEQIMTTAEQSQSHTITPTLEDFWDQLEENAGMRLYHAEHLVRGKKPPLAPLFHPIIQRFQQELSHNEENTLGFFFFLSDGEFSSYQFSPFKQQLEGLGIKIISCYLSKRDFTNDYRILHGTAKEHWSEEAQELWKFASLADIPAKGLSTLIDRGWHIEKEARLFLQINHSTMLTDLLAAILQERQR